MQIVEPIEISGDTKKPRLIDGLWQSFFKEDFYRGVLKTWGGLALRYLLLVCLVFSALTSAGFYLRALAVIESPEIETILNSMPTLTIRKGVMSTKSETLEKVIHPASKNTVVMAVDPQDTIPLSEQANYPVLLQSKEFYIQMPSHTGNAPIKLKYASLFRDSDITGASILKQLKNLADSLVLPTGVIVVVLSFGFALSKSLLVALFLKLCRLKHSYIEMCRLLIVASTPTMLLSGLAIICNIRLGSWDAHLFNVIYIVYAIFAFRACRTVKVPVNEKVT